MRRNIPHIIGIGELQHKASGVIREVNEGNGEGFIVSHNEPRAVLMSLKRYSQLKALEEARLVEEEQVLNAIAEGDREFESGRTQKARSLREFL